MEMLRGRPAVPILMVAFFAGLLRMTPTNVFLINRRGVGILDITPFLRKRASDVVAAAVTPFQWFARLFRAHRVAFACGVVMLALLISALSQSAAAGTLLAFTPVAGAPGGSAQRGLDGTGNNTGGQIRGLASGLLRHGSIAGFRAASPLPIDAQRMIDQSVTRVGRTRLTLVNDLISRNLTFNLPNWLGVPTLYRENVGEAGHAQRTMVPKARGERQIIPRTGSTLPIFCTWDDFSFDIRTLLAAARAGAPLDTSHTEQATRNVNEAIEDQAINGAGFNVDGNPAPGVLEVPQHYRYVDDQSWTHADHSGADILADVQGMIQVLIDQKFYGPYVLYVNTLYWAELMADYKNESDKTVLQRLEELKYSSGPDGNPVNLVVKPADMLPAERTVLIQMTSDVIDVVLGQTPTPLDWEDGPGFERFFIVLACVITRIKANYNGEYGIVLGDKDAH